jgi:glycosyltransferase involved in cell wall biosynthesis
LIDNYELIYLIAARLVRLRRDVRCVLDFEDGKHMIDRSVWRLFSATAEFLGRGIFAAAIVAQPALTERLPAKIPRELVPGFVNDALARNRSGNCVRFLYSGTLDAARGIDLLLQALHRLPDEGWRLDISGSGEFADLVAQTANERRWRDRVMFHGILAADEYADLIAHCHVGLNCQRAADPISRVTFPSKVFSYLSSGLAVLSSRASDVEMVCDGACTYYDGDAAADIAVAMTEFIRSYNSVAAKIDINFVRERYSITATAARLKTLLVKAKLM